MATETVQSLPYARLARRDIEPECVIASVPAQDATSFLRMIARNPLTNTSDASVIKGIVMDAAARRSEEIHGAGPSRSGAKRKHAATVNDDEAVCSLSDGENIGSRRRSTRTKGPQRPNLGGAAAEFAKPSGTPPKIGAEFQAEVPAGALPESERNMEMIPVLSELVYSPEFCNGEANILKYLKSVDLELCKREGFGLSAAGQETALITLTMKNGDVEYARRETLPNVGAGMEFSGTGKPWSYDDKCSFVRGLGETSKNFIFMSRNTLKDRSTSELVFMYYTYHKQQMLQHGSRKGGLQFDTGSELSTLFSKLSPDRTVAALHDLSKTCGDGFPADRRMAKMIRGFHQYRFKLNNSSRSGRERRSGTKNGFRYSA